VFNFGRYSARIRVAMVTEARGPHMAPAPNADYLPV
jgi:hypothetical protein